MNTFMPHNNADDRTEIHRLLTKLSPWERVRFAAWCCRQATLKGSAVNPAVARSTKETAQLATKDDSADAKLSMDIFLDLYHLSAHYNFDLDTALTELVRRVRKK